MSRLKSALSIPIWGFRKSKAPSQHSAAVAMLAGVATASVLLYLFAFVYPYPLLAWYSYPQLTLYDFSQANPMARWWLVCAFLVQGGLYWLGWRAARQASGKLAWLIVLGGALASSTVLLFFYPLGAADIFDNIMHGRILSVYGANPFLNVAQQFLNDPFYPYVAWLYAPSAYGPVWEALAGGVTWLVGDDLIANVGAFKLVNGLFFAGSIGLVALILRRVAPDRALAGVTWLAWNPIILYETMGNGHNDIVMAFWLLAAIWALTGRRYTLAILALLIGMLVKFIPILMLPTAGFIALHHLPGTRARLRFLAVTISLSLALIIIAYWPFWHSFEDLIGQRARFFTASLPASLYYALLLPALGKSQADWVVSLSAASLTVLFTLWQGWQVRRDPAWLGFSRATFNIFMFYLLLTCLWFQEWYVVWPLSVAALLPPGPPVYLALLFGGYTLLAKQFIFGPMLLWIRPLPPRTWFEPRLGPAVLGIPWLYALFMILRQNLKGRPVKPQSR